MIFLNYKKPFFLVVILALGLFSFFAKTQVIFAAQTNPTSTVVVPISELDSRKEALSDALKASHDELNELRDEVNSARVDGDQWQQIKLDLLSQADSSADYYNKISKALNAENIDSESIKSLAKELKSWRENAFNEYLKKSINFILVFEEAALLKIADARLDKISSDLNRLEKQSVSKAKLLSPLFDQAQTHLKLAHDLNDSAKKLLYNYFELSNSSSTATTSAETPNSKTGQKTNIPELTPNKEEPADPQDIIRDMTQKSLEELKTAYSLFVKMSKTL